MQLTVEIYLMITIYVLYLNTSGFPRYDVYTAVSADAGGLVQVYLLFYFDLITIYLLLFI